MVMNQWSTLFYWFYNIPLSQFPSIYSTFRSLTVENLFSSIPLQRFIQTQMFRYPETPSNLIKSQLNTTKFPFGPLYHPSLDFLLPPLNLDFSWLLLTPLNSSWLLLMPLIPLDSPDFPLVILSETSNFQKMETERKKDRKTERHERLIELLRN